MFRRFSKTAVALAKAAPKASSVLAAPARAMSGVHVTVDPKTPLSTPFNTLPYKLGDGTQTYEIRPMTGVLAEKYPIDESDFNPAYAFTLSPETLTQKPAFGAREKKALAFFAAVVGTLFVIEAATIGYHPVPAEVYAGYAELDRRDAIYAAQYEKKYDDIE